MVWNKINRHDSGNENVWKYVFESTGKKPAVAEAVLYRYPTFEERTVICCSTMSGCPIGCRFCGAGDYFVRSLTGTEIVDQVTHLFKDHRVDSSKVDKLQIMFMSMGEPLLNMKHLEYACRTLNQLYPQAALLISTVGPDVDYQPLLNLSKEIDQIGLQFSVHESMEETRNKLVPFDKKLSIAEMAHYGTIWAMTTGRRPYFNYCVHPENNSSEDVERLLSLFKPSIWEATISVVCERNENVSAANQRQRDLTKDFMQLMLQAGYSARMFDPAGQDDIGGGCGQLWYVQDWMKSNPSCAKPSVGRGLPIVHTPN